MRSFAGKKQFGEGGVVGSGWEGGTVRVEIAETVENGSVHLVHYVLIDAVGTLLTGKTVLLGGIHVLTALW